MTVPKIFILAFSLSFAKPVFTQTYQPLPATIQLELGNTLYEKVAIKEVASGKIVHLAVGCYTQSSLADNISTAHNFCVDKGQIINGTMMVESKEVGYKMILYIEQSAIIQAENYLNNQLTEKMLFSYKDSVQYSKNYTADNRLLAETSTWFTQKDSGKTIDIKYYENGHIQYSNDEISGITKEYDQGGVIQNMTQRNPLDANDVTVTEYEKGKKKSFRKGENYFLAPYKEDYDSNEKIAVKQYTNNGTSVTEYYINGSLVQRAQWMTNEGKSVIENFNNGQLESREMITNRYSLADEITESYNSKGVLQQKKVAMLKDNKVYYKIYNGKGKLLKVVPSGTFSNDKEGVKEPGNYIVPSPKESKQ